MSIFGSLGVRHVVWSVTYVTVLRVPTVCVGKGGRDDSYVTLIRSHDTFYLWLSILVALWYIYNDCGCGIQGSTQHKEFALPE